MTAEPVRSQGRDMERYKDTRVSGECWTWAILGFRRLSDQFLQFIQIFTLHIAAELCSSRTGQPCRIEDEWTC